MPPPFRAFQLGLYLNAEERNLNYLWMNMIFAKETGCETLQEVFQRKLKFANSTIPYLNVIVADIVQLAFEHHSIRVRLEQMDSHRRLPGGDEVYSSELKSIKQMADELCDQINECYLELDQIEGITFSTDKPNTIEFPFEVDNGTVHLTWIFGEEQVNGWHWSDETSDSRRPLDQLAASAIQNSVN